LPPSYRGSADDPEKRAAMDAIGESNRMTLLFRKPLTRHGAAHLLTDPGADRSIVEPSRRLTNCRTAPGQHILLTRSLSGGSVDTLDEDFASGLFDDRTPPCISLYQPTSRHHPSNQQDPIRFGNLLKTLERHCATAIRRMKSRTLLEPFHALAADTQFWQHALDGLAVLSAPGNLPCIPAAETGSRAGGCQPTAFIPSRCCEFSNPPTVTTSLA
jgi:hypothetical protein